MRGPAAAQGRPPRAGLHPRCRRARAQAAGPASSRRSPVQLPGDGAAGGWWACGNTVVLKPSRRTPPRRCGWPSCSPRPASQPASSTWCAATRWRSTRCWTHPGVGRRQLRRLHADRALRLRDGDGRTASRCKTRRREEPHGGASPRPTSTVGGGEKPSPAGLGFRQQARRPWALAESSVAVSGMTNARAGRARSPRCRRPLEVGPGTDPAPQWGRWSRARAPPTRSRLACVRGRSRGRGRDGESSVGRHDVRIPKLFLAPT